MTRDEVVAFVRVKIPGGKNITDATIETLIQRAVNDVSFRLKLFPKSQKFAAVAEQAPYTISTNVTNYLSIRAPGFKWKNSDGEYRNVEPYTMAKMYEDYPFWESEGSDDPLRYVIDGDIVTFHPKPDTANADGFQIFFYSAPTQINSGGHYIFTGSTTNVFRYDSLDTSVIAYVQAFIQEALDKKANFTSGFNAYLKFVKDAKKDFFPRPDLVHKRKWEYQRVASVRR